MINGDWLEKKNTTFTACAHYYALSWHCAEYARTVWERETHSNKLGLCIEHHLLLDQIGWSLSSWKYCISSQAIQPYRCKTENCQSNKDQSTSDECHRNLQLNWNWRETSKADCYCGDKRPRECSFLLPWSAYMKILPLEKVLGWEALWV